MVKFLSVNWHSFLWQYPIVQVSVGQLALFSTTIARQGADPQKLEFLLCSRLAGLDSVLDWAETS